jgi:C4-dicarboxylate-specific signal transduction histidine kinase
VTLPVAICAPSGRDGPVLAHILDSASIKCATLCSDELIAGIAGSDFMAVIMTEEALLDMSSESLEHALSNQPVWSDLHFVVLISRGEPSPRLTRMLGLLGNATRRVRPVHPSDLVASVRLAIRARNRQLETCRHIERQTQAEEKLRQLAETLEAQVADRTATLAAYADRLVNEVSERIQTQERMSQMQAELIHVSRLSAMGTMASTLAHELNQPLGAVSNYVSGSLRMLRAGASGKDPHILDALESAVENAQRAGEIVRRLRELVSRGEVDRREESLSKLIDEALVIAMVDANVLNVTCTLDLDPTADTVLVDKVQVQQVLINLIRNAVDAMRSVAERKIRITSRCLDERMVEVELADTGPGLSSEAFASLFSPFSTTKYEGLGLGLSICRTIVESHQGTIVGENISSGGAVFRFTLPAGGNAKKGSALRSKAKTASG